MGLKTLVNFRHHRMGTTHPGSFDLALNLLQQAAFIAKYTTFYLVMLYLKAAALTAVAWLELAFCVESLLRGGWVLYLLHASPQVFFLPALVLLHFLVGIYASSQRKLVVVIHLSSLQEYPKLLWSTHNVLVLGFGDWAREGEGGMFLKHNLA